MTTQSVEVAKANVPPVAITGRSAGKARFLYLDNLRMTVITAVVLMHTAIMYGAEGAWFYHESGEKSTLIFVIMMLLGGIGAAFTMGLLFLVAGYFTPRAYDRKGAGPFLIDRFKRLGIPLLFFEIVILQLVNYPISVHAGKAQSLGQYLLDHFQNLNTIGDGPVWFLEELQIGRAHV
jgi:glucan biosynthesis protein C